MVRLRKDLIALKAGAGSPGEMARKCRLCPYCGKRRGFGTGGGTAVVRGKFYHTRHPQRCTRCGGAWCHVYDEGMNNYGIIGVQRCE